MACQLPLLSFFFFFVTVYQSLLRSSQNSVICGASLIISMANTARISFLVLVKNQSTAATRLGQLPVFPSHLVACPFRVDKKYSPADRFEVICHPHPLACCWITLLSVALPGPVSPAVCTGCMVTYSQAIFWSQQSDSPELVGVVTALQEAEQRKEQDRCGFFPSLCSPPKLSWQVLYPFTCCWSVTQGRQCLIPCSETITTGLHHDTWVISRTLTWRNTQLNVMVWQSHRSTLHSPGEWARALQAQQPDFATAIWTRVHLQTWMDWVKEHSACWHGLEHSPTFLVHSSQEHGFSVLSPVLLLPTCAFSPGKRWNLGQGERKMQIEKNLRWWVGKNPNFSSVLHVP